MLGFGPKCVFLYRVSQKKCLIVIFLWGCPPCYGLVNITVALQWGGGEITPKAEKSLNHSILTFIDREMRLGHVDT